MKEHTSITPEVKVKDIIEGGHIASVKFEYNEVQLELNNGFLINIHAQSDEMGHCRLSVEALKKVLTKVAGVSLD